MEHKEAGSGLNDFVSRETNLNGNLERSSRQSDGERARIENISFCASPSEQMETRKRPAKYEAASLGGMLRKAVLNHQLGLSLNLIVFGALTYLLFPRLRSWVEPFFHLEYALPNGQFYQGPKDAGLVFFFIVLFTALRAASMEYLLIPFAKVCGMKKQKPQLRFAEQAYILFYYIVMWSWGLQLFVEDTPTSSATTVLDWTDDLLISLWTDFPRLAMTASMKAYYLSQTAFWFQQVLVIHLEERRKDHYQMLAHHFITIGLLVFSYSFRQMRVGNAILVLMDVVDLVFPLAKCLRYAGLQTACDIAFGVFVLAWFVARHILYVGVFYSLVTHVGSRVMPYGTYSTVTSSLVSQDGGIDILDNLLQPLLNQSANTVQFNSSIRSVFIALLGGLQIITIIWFGMICRVVARVLRGEGADDSRSDDEGEEEDLAEDLEADGREIGTGSEPEQKYIEITAEGDDLYYARANFNSATNNSNSRNGVSRKKSKGISSGLNLGEHKDILNRIGCLSEEQLARERERRQESNSPQPGSSRRRS